MTARINDVIAAGVLAVVISVMAAAVFLGSFWLILTAVTWEGGP